MRAFREAKNTLGQAASARRGGLSTVVMKSIGDHDLKHRYSHQLSGKAAKQAALGTELNSQNLDKLGKSTADRDIFNTVNKYQELGIEDLENRAKKLLPPLLGAPQARARSITRNFDLDLLKGDTEKYAKIQNEKRKNNTI